MCAPAADSRSVATNNLTAMGTDRAETGRHERQLRRIALWAAAWERLDGGSPASPDLRDAAGGGVLADTGEGAPKLVRRKEEALEALLEEAGHADARRPEWVRRRPDGGWLVEPSEMRIVLQSDPGTLAQIVYPTGPAADGSERAIRCEHREAPGTPEAPPPAEPPAWTSHLTAGALMLRERFLPAAGIWKNAGRGQKPAAAAAAAGAPPQAQAGYEGLAALYAAHQWLAGEWRHRPPADVVERLGVVLGDGAARTAASRTGAWSFATPAAVRSAAAAAAAAELSLRRVGWTLPFDAPGAPMPADQARIVVGGGELLCRIAMSGQLTDPQPPGIDHADWRGRWSTPAAEPLEHLCILGAEWAAGLVRLTDENATSADSQRRRQGAPGSSRDSH